MIPGEFIIKGRSSLDYNTIIQDRPLIEAPVRNREVKESSGRDGVVINDRKTYKETPLNLILYTTGTHDEKEYDVRSELHSLFDGPGYVDVVFYFDPDKIYKVRLDEDSAVQFENKYYYNHGQSWKVELKVYPWKELTMGEQVLVTTGDGTVTESTLYNPTNNIALPIIEMYAGEGNSMISINGREFHIKDLENYPENLFLDSDTQMAYRPDHWAKEGYYENENDKIITRDYPYLDPGENVIAWSGPIGYIKINPRWRVLV